MFRKSVAPLALMVEDEVVIQQYLLRSLKPMGLDILIAGHGDQAMRYLEMVQPDIVLLDIQLPGENGIALLQRMRLKFPQLPVLMLTALHNDQTAILAKRHGASDYLTKPIQLETLQRAIKTHLLVAL